MHAGIIIIGGVHTEHNVRIFCSWVRPRQQRNMLPSAATAVEWIVSPLNELQLCNYVDTLFQCAIFSYALSLCYSTIK